MHLALTDILTCPRCGPEFGLILLADRLEARRVYEGVLGCMNCRERYPVRGGCADLRPLTGTDAGTDTTAGAGAGEREGEGVSVGVGEGGGGEEAFRIAALLGIREGPALALVAGPEARWAAGVAAIVPELEGVALASEVAERVELAAAAEVPGVSRVAAGVALPFFDRALGGVVLTGEWAERVEEGARVVAPGGRLVLVRGPAGAAERVVAAGLEVVMEQEDVLVATRPERAGLVQLGRR
jgi:uncharacterized protein YbaR (Trm112 family)